MFRHDVKVFQTWAVEELVVDVLIIGTASVRVNLRTLPYVPFYFARSTVQ